MSIFFLIFLDKIRCLFYTLNMFETPLLGANKIPIDPIAKVCPDFGYLSVQGKLAGQIDIRFLNCVKANCAKWNARKNQCGMIVGNDTNEIANG